MIRWRVIYEDGTYVEEDGTGVYGRLDRANAKTLELYADETSPAPFFRRSIPQGYRLVVRTRRKRSWGGPVTPPFFKVVVAFESKDRSQVDAYFFEAYPDTVRVVRRSGYDEKGPYRAPELYDKELTYP